MSEPFDESAKIFYRRLFHKWGMRVESQREIFFRARTIDLVVSCTEEDHKRLSNTVFSHFRRLNSIELKGSDDPVTDKSYNRAVMRAWGLGGLDLPAEQKRQQKLSQEEENLTEEAREERASALQVSDLQVRHPSDRTLTIITVVRPDKLLADERLRFQATEEPGIYYCDEQLPKWIICPSELRVTEQNYPLLPLSKGQKLEEFIKRCLSEGMVEYLQLVLDIGLAKEPLTIWNALLEATQMEIKVSEETWPTIDKFFRLMPQAMEKLPTIRDMIAQKEREAREAQRLLAQKEQEAQRLIAQKEREAREAQRLIAQKEREAREAQRLLAQKEREALRVIVTRQLRLKFGEVSPQIITQIEETEDHEQLLRWLDQLVLATNLADTDFGAKE